MVKNHLSYKTPAKETILLSVRDKYLSGVVWVVGLQAPHQLL